MGRKKTPSYTYELKLLTDKYQEDIIDTMMYTSRQFYNSGLGFIFRKLNAMKNSSKYKENNKLFKECKEFEDNNKIKKTKINIKKYEEIYKQVKTPRI
jgi:mannose-1-phosphate guanylyltransferase